MFSLLLLFQSYTWSPEIDNKANWKQFENWEVFSHHGEFDTDSVTIVRTLIDLDQKDRNGQPIQRTFGFRIFGRNYYQFETGIEGKGTWPYCDYEFSKYAVDGRKASFFPTAGGGGVCEHVTQGRWLSEFQRGSQVRLSVNFTTATGSLRGFDDAWRYAMTVQ
jgi:hypothetical protein